MRPVLAANHDKIAIESHATNFPETEHFRGDIRDVDVARHPYGELYWASPECTNWTIAKGKRADYADHPGLWDEEGPGEDVERSRALMEDVVRYLRGMAQRSEPVLAGVVENVTDIRKWVHWGRWRGEIEALGYKTRLIALNSAHAAPHRTPRAPQSRDRLYLAYWHSSLGRDPDWDKWLRPRCWCSTCEEVVDGIQTWKREGQDMGRYGAQYYYRCPKVSCRGARVEPFYLPAQEVIDWSIPGQRIGDRAKPLSAKTMARIEAALRKWGPAVAASGNHHGLLVPYYGKSPSGGAHVGRMTDQPMGTLTGAPRFGLLVPYYGTRATGAPTSPPLGTVTTHDKFALIMRNNTARGDQGQMSTPATEPLRTLTTSGHQSLLEPPNIDPLDCLFRMLEPHEIGAGMAFMPD